MPQEGQKQEYFVYLLSCKDGSLYCGSAKNVQKRLQTHASGKGAKYTKSRLPVSLVYVERCADQSAALKREWQIKRLTRSQKLALVAAWQEGQTAPF